MNEKSDKYKLLESILERLNKIYSHPLTAVLKHPIEELGHDVIRLANMNTEEIFFSTYWKLNEELRNEVK
jgi:hypothetical protein